MLTAKEYQREEKREKRKKRKRKSQVQIVNSNSISIMEEDENTKTRWEVLAKVMSRLKTPSLKTVGRPFTRCKPSFSVA